MIPITAAIDLKWQHQCSPHSHKSELAGLVNSLRGSTALVAGSFRAGGNSLIKKPRKKQRKNTGDEERKRRKKWERRRERRERKKEGEGRKESGKDRECKRERERKRKRKEKVRSRGRDTAFYDFVTIWSSWSLIVSTRTSQTIQRQFHFIPSFPLPGKKKIPFETVDN